jgi:hypothetical protein
MINYMSPKVGQRCVKCGEKLTSFIAYIPSRGEACMDCYIEAAKKDEVNTSL